MDQEERNLTSPSPYDWRLASSSLNMALGPSPIASMAGPYNTTQHNSDTPPHGEPNRAASPPSFFRHAVVGTDGFQIPMGTGGRPRSNLYSYGVVGGQSEDQADNASTWRKIYAQCLIVTGNLPSLAIQRQARRDTEFAKHFRAFIRNLRRASRDAVELDPTYILISHDYRTFAPGTFDIAKENALYLTSDLARFLEFQLPLFPHLKASLRRVTAALLLDPLIADSVDLGGGHITAKIFGLPFVLIYTEISSYHREGRSVLRQAPKESNLMPDEFTRLSGVVQQLGELEDSEELQATLLDLEQSCIGL